MFDSGMSFASGHRLISGGSFVAAHRGTASDPCQAPLSSKSLGPDQYLFEDGDQFGNISGTMLVCDSNNGKVYKSCIQYVVLCFSWSLLLGPTRTLSHPVFLQWITDFHCRRKSRRLAIPLSMSSMHRSWPSPWRRFFGRRGRDGQGAAGVGEVSEGSGREIGWCLGFLGWKKTGGIEISFFAMAETLPHVLQIP